MNRKTPTAKRFGGAAAGASLDPSRTLPQIMRSTQSSTDRKRPHRARSSPSMSEGTPPRSDGERSGVVGTYPLVYASVRGALDHLSRPDLDEAATAARDAINAHANRRSVGGGQSS